MLATIATWMLLVGVCSTASVVAQGLAPVDRLPPVAPTPQPTPAGADDVPHVAGWPGRVAGAIAGSNAGVHFRQSDDDLLDRLEAAEAELRALRGELAGPGVESLGPIPGDDEESLLPDDTDAPEPTVAEGASPVFPVIRPSGFFQLDSGWFTQDAVSRQTFGDIEDGVGFRRARLQAVGSVTEMTNFSIEFDFAFGGRPSFMDIWVEQTHLPIFGRVRIGQFRMPFSMDALTSIRELTFLERSLPFQAFVPFRRLGIMAFDVSDDERTTWAYAAYRSGAFLNAPLGDNRFGFDLGDQGGWAFSGRLTHLVYYDPLADDRYLVHVGGGYNYTDIAGSDDTAFSKIYAARAVPEFFVGDPAGGGLTAAGTPFFVDTGRLPANDFHLFGTEFAWQWGALNFQSEYMAVIVEQIGAPQVFYYGAYGQVGYFLTGEHHIYDHVNASFANVVPFTNFFGIGRHRGMCGWGAWEVAARWSYADTVDPNAVANFFDAGPPPSPNPGRLHDITLGVNWYWNPHAKIQFNYILALLDNVQFGDSTTDIYALRCQLDF